MNSLYHSPRQPSSLVSRLRSTLRCGRRLRLLSPFSAHFVADETRDRRHAIGGLQPLEPYALGGPANQADLIHPQPGDLALMRDHHDLIAGLHLHHPDDGAVSLRGPNVDDPLAPPSLQAILN